MTAAHDLAREVLRVTAAVWSADPQVHSHVTVSYDDLTSMRALAEAVLRECPPAPDTAASGNDVGVGGGGQPGEANARPGAAEVALRGLHGEPLGFWGTKRGQTAVFDIDLMNRVAKLKAERDAIRNHGTCE